MKIQTKVISPLGTFESDVAEVDITPEQVDEVKRMYEQCHKLNYLSIQQGSKTVYIPAEVIRQSVIILDVSG